MPFKVCCIDNREMLEAVPAALICHYPGDRVGYKPYAQCSLCLDARDNLLLRMWAFEVNPPGESLLRAVLYLWRDKPGQALQVDLQADGSLSLARRATGQETELASPPDCLHPHQGEDLQGIYWGGLVVLPRPWLEEIDPGLSLAVGDRLAANFYKLCGATGREHRGSFYPADFAADPYAKDSMETMLVVPY